ncbi:MAG: sigma-70 family RNA polymerase sigma factor [Phaeodactylibacter sp.]|nr:sigma-70 family RNA polymerase sigma factor [Phaeodactylibacter sp.]MCB9052824.1 sigma-70 family RNA polymerase sigma factor [Lewinellaceae bacterium]
MHRSPDVLERARQGDQAAFRQLVEEHEALVRSTVAGMLGDTGETDDVAQEVFIRFYKALKDFRGDAQIGTYLCRIAINLSINELKSRRRRSRWLSVAGTAERGLSAEDNSMDPARQDMRDALRKALQLLEPDFRAVVVLRLIDGYSVKETAEILNLPQGTVASRLARGQQKLREILEKWL